MNLLEKYKELTKGCGFYTIFMKNYSVYVTQNIKKIMNIEAPFVIHILICLYYKHLWYKKKATKP